MNGYTHQKCHILFCKVCSLSCFLGGVFLVSSRDHHLFSLSCWVPFVSHVTGWVFTEPSRPFLCVYKWYKQPLKASQKSQVVRSNLFSQEGCCLSLYELPILKQYLSAEGVCQATSKAGLNYLGGATVKIKFSLKFKLIWGMSAVVLHIFSPRKTLRCITGAKQLTGNAVRVTHKAQIEMLHSLFPVRHSASPLAATGVKCGTLVHRHNPD